MIYISSKDIEELDEGKLQTFFLKQYRENRFLDYKLKYQKRTDDEAKEELLADITGFANYYGGNIIVGVEELEEEGQYSLPGNLIGIEDGSKIAEAYRNLCDTSIDPPIAGLVIKEIPLKNEKWAIVIYVPVSLRRPHMITFRGKNRFYIRHDDRTVKMTTDEVKRTVIEVVDIERTLKEYVKRIEEEIIADFLGTDFSLIMQAVPYLIEEDQIDTSSEEIKKILMDRSVTGSELESGYIPMPNLHGIFTGDGRANPSYFVYVHRTGYVGLAYNLKERLAMSEIKDKTIGPWIEKYFLKFLNICNHMIEKGNIASPYQIHCTFINAEGAFYRYKDKFNIGWEQSEIKWKRKYLKLPGIRIDNFQNIESISKLIFERLQNAFGLPYP